jgi:hypothetical protein
MNPNITIHYTQIWKLIKDEEASLPGRLAGMLPDTRPWHEPERSSIMLYVQNLPHPSRASEREIKEVFHQIRTGKLEWAFHLKYEGKSLGIFLLSFED